MVAHREVRPKYEEPPHFQDSDTRWGALVAEPRPSLGVCTLRGYFREALRESGSCDESCP